MLYILFVLAIIATALYFTAPGFILRKKFRGRDLYEILSEEEHNNRLKILGRGVHSIIYLIVYYPTLFLAIPLVILWAILNRIGLQVVSYIATATIAFMVFDFGRWLWRTISGDKGKAEIIADDGERYRGKLVSEEKLIIADATIMKAEIELKDGTRKSGRKTYILGEKPFRDFLRNLPDLILVLYLWYLVVVLLTSF